MGKDLAVNAAFADPSGDKLVVLGPEVQNSYHVIFPTKFSSLLYIKWDNFERRIIGRVPLGVSSFHASSLSPSLRVSIDSPEEEICGNGPRYASLQGRLYSVRRFLIS